MKNFSVKTKGSFRLSSREPERRKYLAWVIGALIALFFLHGIIGSTTSVFSALLYTAREYVRTSSATIPVFIRGRVELLNQMQSLEQKVASGQGIETTLNQVMKENEELRTLLSSTTTPRIAAGVVARPPFTPYDTLVLDRGSEDGIVENTPVYYGKGIALGYVRTVFAHTALVTLFSSPGVETTTYIFDSHIFTTAHGEGGGVIRLSVPQGIPLTQGSVVALPALDGGALGVIGDIQSIPTEPEQHAYVTLAVPLQSIHFVAVATRPVAEHTFLEAKEIMREEEKNLFTITIPESERVQEIPTVTVVATTTSSTPPLVP